jgi:O-antigen/teichoic acid export membrane protein
LKPFDESGKFQAIPDGGAELRRLAVQGAGVTVLSQGVMLAVQIITTVVLARLLMPSDFGVVAMVSTFSLLLTSFPGFTEAVLQREQINHFLASNLFWISTGVGIVLTAAFAGAGSLLAWFYGDPRVVDIAIALSFQIFINGISIVHQALLQRAMRFPAVSANEIIARVMSVVVSISCAWAGCGYWALVAGILTFPFSRSVGAWYLCRWVPGLPRRAAGTEALARFTKNVYGRYTVDYFAHNMDNVLVGWRFGAQPLGFYKKAYDLFALPANQLVKPLTAVAVAALSRFKSDPARYRRYLLNALAVTAFVGMGLGADLTLTGKDVIRLLLGPNWAQSGRIFTFLGLGIGFMFVHATHDWIHLSIGTTERYFRWGLVEFGVTGLLFIPGLSWGPEGVAIAWTVSYAILTLPAFWYAGRPIRLGVAPVISTVWRYLLAAGLAAWTSAMVIRLFPFLGALPGAAGALARIVAISSLFGVLYLSAVVLLHGSWSPLYQVARLVREMLPSSWTLRPVPSGVANAEVAAGATLTPAREEETLSDGGVPAGVGSSLNEGR